eukprot:10348180-Alexandrium_andersonii.AAC.1
MLHAHGIKGRHVLALRQNVAIHAASSQDFAARVHRIRCWASQLCVCPANHRISQTSTSWVRSTARSPSAVAGASYVAPNPTQEAA